jgi:hypothetical protein
MSTTSKYPLSILNPPPKNILFVDDVDARQQRGSERVAVNQVLLVTLNISTTDEYVEPYAPPPPNATISPTDVAARSERA